MKINLPVRKEGDIVVEGHPDDNALYVNKRHVDILLDDILACSESVGGQEEIRKALVKYFNDPG